MSASPHLFLADVSYPVLPSNLPTKNRGGAILATASVTTQAGAQTHDMWCEFLLPYQMSYAAADTHLVYTN